MDFSLNELDSVLTEGEGPDILLECTATIRVDISIERLHQYRKDEHGKPRVVLASGYVISLGLPSSDNLASGTQPFADGERQMVCDLHYAGEERDAVSLEDAVRALGIDPDAKIWRCQPAP